MSGALNELCRRRVCLVARVEDFSLADLTQPSAERFIRIMSALINLCQIREEREPFLTEMWSESLRIHDERSQLVKDVDMASARIDALK